MVQIYIKNRESLPYFPSSHNRSDCGFTYRLTCILFLTIRALNLLKSFKDQIDRTGVFPGICKNDSNM